MERARSDTPWTRLELAGVAGINLAAFAALALAFGGSTDTDTLDGQVTWLNLAVFGLSVGLGADAALFFTARRSIGRRRLRVYPNIPVRQASTVPSGKDGPWVWLPGSDFAHRAECPMVRGKMTVPAGVELIRREGLIRCEVCEC